MQDVAKGCSHIAGIRDVTPSALGCEECLKSGSEWLHLRICRTCGHVGCCDDSPNKHATAHFHATRPSGDRRLRSAGRLGLVLCRRSAVRSVEPKDSAQRSDPALLLIRLSTKNEEYSDAMRDRECCAPSLAVMWMALSVALILRASFAQSLGASAAEQIRRGQRRQAALSGRRQGRSRRAAARLCRNQPYVAAADRESFPTSTP